MEIMQQSQAKAQRRDFAKPVAGVQVGEGEQASHYSIREVGYRFGAVKVVTEVQLVVDGEIKARGVEPVRAAVYALLWPTGPWIDTSNAEFLLRALDSVQAVTYFDSINKGAR